VACTSAVSVFVIVNRKTFIPLGYKSFVLLLNSAKRLSKRKCYVNLKELLNGYLDPTLSFGSSNDLRGSVVVKVPCYKRDGRAVEAR
jgi:hypothetical protein